VLPGLSIARTLAVAEVCKHGQASSSIVENLPGKRAFTLKRLFEVYFSTINCCG
jgi:hypothetical protein